jgi:hypothetical protein
MGYSVNLIGTQADCDLLLSLAAKEKSNLEFQKLSTQRQRENYAETAAAVAAELQAVDAELAALGSIIATLPDGDVKDDNITRQKRLELRKRLLDDRKENYGSVALLEKELGIDRIDKELAAMQDFIVAVQERKAVL